ncbi:SRPBCC family protein [Microbacterium hominis]|uniref:SRPBCC family protein n=1 Tax=Microbacterium TaxID=33882 RepID=UPI00168B0B28|nr:MULTISPECIES: SRPBCC family protein [Microbacterium]QOC26769.1 SRPBCC family protein [Microbacterium hominis]QOC27947.1 SRPBCC family protein [Microbacterium hominis]QYF96903.1 SRPBCC family protein [Microbacterium sp. PAMC21962]
MNPLTAQREIHASPQIIADIIMNIAELADWNPALNSTGTRDLSARLGHPYPVSTRVPGRATLTYTDATIERIVWRLEVAGSSETGQWDVRAHGEKTLVTHTMLHAGALFAVMHNAMTNVPTLRLDRLQQRAERRALRP